ncbi:MAG: FAD-dependent oxidoreductase [Betaproteobacteria bacterium]
MNDGSEHPAAAPASPWFPEYFPYRRPPELDDADISHRTVIVVGAGPVGLAMALDWAQRGHDVLVLTANHQLSEGSRAICFAKRTLEICDRLGCGDVVVNKGVSWNVGKVFLQDRLLYEFNLLPETGFERPAFVNLQQYYFEQFELAELAARRDQATGQHRIELRWKSRVTAVTPAPDRVRLEVECPDGTYALWCDWLIVCDGAGSPVRKMLGQKTEGQVFKDRFLIADVRLRGASAARFATERWFWFDPPFHRNQSVLLHRQADDIWRIDFQLGWQADPDVERQPGRVRPRIQAMLGDDVEFDLDWVSVYTFQCRRMERFVHDRVIFAGDAAHQVSPFGARGANSGIQDVDNLGWKLDLIVRGLAPVALLESYDLERAQAADENILNSTRSTDFITPKSDISRTFRDATLELAARYPFARKLVNSGRLSVPAQHFDSPLNTADVESWSAGAALAPGSPALDAPVLFGGRPGWLLRHLGGTFAVFVFAPQGELPAALHDALLQAALLPIPVHPIVVTRAPVLGDDAITWLVDKEGLAFARYAPDGEAVYLLRPDQHVAGRHASLTADWIGAALRSACMTETSFATGAC